MGQLKALKLPTDTVEALGGSLVVRGLSAPDIAAIVRDRGPLVKSLFNRLTGADGTADQPIFNLDDLGEMGVVLMDLAPQIVIDIIFHGLSGEDEEERQVAARLPLAIQTEALEKIMALTFEAEGGLKKVVETVVRLFKGTRSQVGQVRTSMSGSQASADK